MPERENAADGTGDANRLALTDESIQSFIDKGFVRIDHASSSETADRSAPDRIRSPDRPKGGPQHHRVMGT